MGAACLPCSSRSKCENIYNDFWKNLKIRTIPQSDWSLIVKTNIDTKNTKKINEATWEKIMKKNLVKEEDSEQSSKVFRKAMALSEEKGGQYLLLISLLFICPKNSLNTKKEFEDMASVTFHLKDHFSKPENKLLVKKNFLIEVIAFYVNLISLFCADDISEGMEATPKSHFRTESHSNFHLDVQKKFLEEDIIKEFTEEWVDLDVFFQTKYSILSDDMFVRERLRAWHEKESQNRKISL
jgi:hypothetical protein